MDTNIMYVLQKSKYFQYELSMCVIYLRSEHAKLRLSKTYQLKPFIYLFI